MGGILAGYTLVSCAWVKLRMWRYVCQYIDDVSDEFYFSAEYASFQEYKKSKIRWYVLILQAGFFPVVIILLVIGIIHANILSVLQNG